MYVYSLFYVHYVSVGVSVSYEYSQDVCYTSVNILTQAMYVYNTRIRNMILLFH